MQTVDRALTLLQTVSEKEGNLTDVARRAGLHPSTAYRIMETLCFRGYLVQDFDSGRYSIGPKAFLIGASYRQADALQRAARPVMDELRDEVNENVNLIIRDAHEAVYVDQAESRQALRMFTRVGARVPLHCAGAGKALLFGMPDKRIADVLGPEPFEKATDKTLTTLEEFLEDLRRSEQKGYAIDDEERELGVRCVAAPIYGLNQMMVAALSLSAPAARLNRAGLREFGPRVKVAANKIGQRLQ